MAPFVCQVNSMSRSATREPAAISGLSGSDRIVNRHRAGHGFIARENRRAPIRGRREAGDG